MELPHNRNFYYYYYGDDYYYYFETTIVQPAQWQNAQLLHEYNTYKPDGSVFVNFIFVECARGRLIARDEQGEC